MKIGTLEIDSKAFLAPLAGITDKAFREICQDYGAGYCETEMVSAKALSFGDKKSFELMEISDNNHPCGIQLFGNDPEIMAQGAKLALSAKADVIDINMGCPAPKVANNGCGSALMKDPELCGRIVYAIKAAVDIPVTVKIRKGFDDDSVNAVQVAKLCADNGADGIIVHGRTRKQYYSGTCDLDIIKQVKESVSVPVIGNGDVKDIKSAEKMLSYTGCDGVMVARAALGAPWIFKILEEYFSTGNIINPPSNEDKLKVMINHIERICHYKGEYMGVLQSRKHMAWYLKGFKGAAGFRNEAGKVSTLEEVYKLAQRVLENR
ncbi:MAG: tRNA dihydrouridine synthase DusB [Ruminococcus sp.]